MKHAKAFIWDLDGTLLDSYGIIVASLQDTYLSYGIETNPDDILHHVIKYSVSSFIHSMEEKTGITFAEMKEHYSSISNNLKKDISLIPHAKEVLDQLHADGHRNFVFTHRGASTESVLQNLGIQNDFEEILTSQDHFPRKPSPDALLYLMEKYELSPHDTYYVGDRSIDMECAKNAGVDGILFLPPTSVGEPTGVEEFVIADLLEISNLI